MVFSYRWAEEAPYTAPAQAVGERLQAIAAESEGRLHPRDVVADARSETSPLHPLFEWNDRRAAVAHRLEQARALITHLVVVRVEAGEEELLRYAHRAETEDHPERFVAVNARLERFSMVTAAERARRELSQWIKRYRGRPELGAAVEQAERALEEIGVGVAG